MCLIFNEVTIQNLEQVQEISEERLEKEIDIYRRISEEYPQKYLEFLAKRLSDLGDLYLDTQRWDEAYSPFNEANGIYQKLSEKEPGKYKPLAKK